MSIVDVNASDRLVPRRVALMLEPSPFTYISGLSNRYKNFIRYLREFNCEVLVITTGKGWCPPWADNSGYRDPPKEFYGAKVVPLFTSCLPYQAQVPQSLSLTPFVYKELQNFQPDIIHSCSPSLMDFTATIYARMLRIPVVLSFHTDVEKYLPYYGIQGMGPKIWWLMSLAHNHAHLRIASSKVTADKLYKCTGAHGQGKKALKYQVWPKAMDTDQFNPAHRSEEMRARLSPHNPKATIVLYVGRVSVEKNLPAFEYFSQKLPEVHFAIVGDGPYKKTMMEDMEGKNVTFLGVLRGQELSQAYASADIFVLPSETETLGFVVLEAMASGVPVVAAAAGGVPSTINQPGVSSYLYPPGDLDTAVKYIRGLAADPAARAAMAAAATEETKRLSWRDSTHHILTDLYPTAVEAAIAEYGGAGLGGRWGQEVAETSSSCSGGEGGARWGGRGREVAQRVVSKAVRQGNDVAKGVGVVLGGLLTFGQAVLVFSQVVLVGVYCLVLQFNKRRLRSGARLRGVGG